MTSLTDKIEGLRKDTPNEFDIGSERSTPKIIRDNGFNQALNVCIALSLAEVAVVGDWEAEFDKQFVSGGFSGVMPQHRDGGQILKRDLKTFITNLLAAKDREREELIQTRLELGESLQDMYSQYCQDGHSFMSAGEGAAELLEHYGYGSFDEIGRMTPPTK